MKTGFAIHFMDEALAFMYNLDAKSRAKVAFNIQKAKAVHDSEIFKKITNHIWEFRNRYYKSQIRLFAFWNPYEQSMVVCTHGIFKKSPKTPQHEIDKAERLRAQFIQMKQHEKE